MRQATDTTLDGTNESRLRWTVKPCPEVYFLTPVDADTQENDDSLFPETLSRQMHWFSDAWSKLAQL